MAIRAPLTDAVYRIIPKRGKNDCAIAVLATYLRRDYEEVLLAAGKVAPSVWTAGISGTQMIAVARRLGVRARWVRTFDMETDTGALWVSYHDSTLEHMVFLHDGWVFDPEHNPVSMWEQDDFLRHTNAYGQQLLQIVED